MDEISIIERIYDHMAQMEWVELRLPPYAMFDEHGVDTEDVAYLLAMMRKEYDFEITDVPECVQDVVDLVCHREFTRLTLRERAEQRMSQYNYDTFRPVKPLLQDMVDRLLLMFNPNNTTMKKTLLAIVAALLLVSCSQNDEVREKKAIEFIVDGLEVDYTRATLADASITDLYIWEGETLLKHQVSTDADFGSPTIELDYGTHNLTFVASKATGQSWASGKWTCTKVDDTFGRVMELQVAKGSSTSQSVELSRVIAKVQWTIEDKVPASAVSMDVSVTNYLSLTADLSGADATTYAVSGHNISSWAGIQGKQPCVSVIPATFGSESNAAATITFHKADESVICAYTKYVTVLSNRTTNIHGSFFAIQPTLGVSLNTSWADQKDVDL